MDEQQQLTPEQALDKAKRLAWNYHFSLRSRHSEATIARHLSVYARLVIRLGYDPLV